MDGLTKQEIAATVTAIMELQARIREAAGDGEGPLQDHTQEAELDSLLTSAMTKFRTMAREPNRPIN